MLTIIPNEGKLIYSLALHPHSTTYWKISPTLGKLRNPHKTQVEYLQ